MKTMNDFFQDERPLHQMPYAQAKVRDVYLKSEIPVFLFRELISYQTCVATLSHDGWLEIHGLYSQTTRRHLSAFLKEYGLNYSIAKMCFVNKVQYNIQTAEIREIPKL